MIRHFAIAGVCVGLVVTLCAEGQVTIRSVSQDGLLTFDGALNGTTAIVQWARSPAVPESDWATWTTVVVTAPVVALPVPMAFRVLVPPGPNTLNAGLGAHWPMDGGAFDVSGLNNHGTAIFAEPTGDRHGNALGALRFDGLDDWVEVAQSDSIEPQRLAIAAWIRPELDVAHDQMLIISSNGSAGGGYNFFLNARSTTGWTLQLDLHDGRRWHMTRSAPIIVDQHWTHVCGTYDGNVTTLFVDGAPVAQQEGSFVVGYSADAIDIGRNAFATDDHFKGTIDDLRIYRRALDPVEVTALAQF